MNCVQGSICFEWLKGIPTTLVALVVAAIAVEQWRVAKAKLKLDLFDKRYAIFLETWRIMSEVVTAGTKTQNYGLGNPFSNFIPQARFLFGKDIETYLRTAVKNWADLKAADTMVGHIRENALENTATRNSLIDWFMTQADHGLKDRFGRYLNFERWI